MTTHTTLKPCPHCGGTEIQPVASTLGGWWIACESCGVSGPTCRHEPGAGDAWNALPRRSDVTAPQARIAELEAAVAPVDHAELREQLADLEHQQWAHWTQYMLDVLKPVFDESHDRYGDGCSTEGEDAALDQVSEWERQITTGYADLSEKEKDSDREWASKVLAIVKPAAPVEWREGVPPIDVIAEHEEAGALWLYSYDDHIALYQLHTDGVDVVSVLGSDELWLNPDEMPGLGAGQWRPCSPDGTPYTRPAVTSNGAASDAEGVADAE